MVSFGGLPKLSRPRKHPVGWTSKKVAELRKWTQEYGKSTRQLSVRAKSTKDDLGTLPISAYERRTLKMNPSLLSLVEIRNNIDMQESSSSESEDDDVSCRIEDNA